MTHPPGWLELLVRLCAGEADEPPLFGVVEILEDEEPEEPEEDGERQRPSRARVWKDRHRCRVETLDGELLEIRGDEHVFRFGEPGAAPHRARADRSFDGFGSTVLRRRDPWDWRPGDLGEDGDYTRPTGPPAPVSFLGREALLLELSPPAHKSGLLRETVDARTGMTYRVENTAHGVLAQWLELDEVAAHDEDLFRWDGDFVELHGFSFGSDTPLEELPEQLREQIAAERALEGRLQRELDPGVVGLTVSGDLWAHGEEDGSVSVSWDPTVHVRYGRHRVELEPDDEPGTTWVDGPWRYFVQGHGVSTDDLRPFEELLRRWARDTP